MPVSLDSLEPVSRPFDPQVAMDHLCQRDRRLARVIAVARAFQFEMEPEHSPYDSLLEAIVYQSISGKAAATILGRIVALGHEGRAPAPAELLRVRPATLRQAGLSRAKVAALRDLARQTLAGLVPTLQDAHGLSDQELVKRLVAVRGVGAWTVEMFLISRLGRPDVLPIHDYGVQKGFALTYGKKELPKPRELAAFGERWRPYRTVAAWYLWRAVELAGPATRQVSKRPARAASAGKANSRRASRPRRARAA